MAKKKTGPARMKELGRRKSEVWFSDIQMEQIARIATLLGLPVATFIRRAANYMTRGGEATCQPLRAGYD